MVMTPTDAHTGAKSVIDRVANAVEHVNQRADCQHDADAGPDRHARAYGHEQLNHRSDGHDDADSDADRRARRNADQYVDEHAGHGDQHGNNCSVGFSK